MTTPRLAALRSELDAALAPPVSTEPIAEPEGAEYAAHRWSSGELRVRYREAKITPTKVGAFFTLWVRSARGPIRPLTAEDGADLVIVDCMQPLPDAPPLHGRFYFPAGELLRRGVLSAPGREGKRALRVYPAWVTVPSAQAAATQRWQAPYFAPAGSPDSARLLRAAAGRA
ncbi:MepB family protein [Mycetocola spongiae]|uniref:MepB family protein n=1 Tax=Mycetocola spongiae TaxID=2859226 RepID=UPI001CF58246|nr:MepB family protein [Mycetocola spongiae]UCR88518.1 MepB family protein [Mycetocola spongiae]